MARQRFRLATRRTVTPARLPRGEDADVLLEVANTDARPGGLWVLTEQLPARARRPAALRRRPAGRRRDGAAALPACTAAGAAGTSLGPLRLRLVDPFGLVRAHRRRQRHRGAAGRPAGAAAAGQRRARRRGHGGGGEGSRRSIAVHGEDDVSTREYRYGDDLRKVHWRATARTGELMVRLEERPWRAAGHAACSTPGPARTCSARAAPAVAPRPAGDDRPPHRTAWSG